MKKVSRRFYLVVLLPASAFFHVALVQADEPGTAEFYLDQVQSIASSRLSIAYQTAVGGGPVTQVDAYVTSDQGRAWLRFASQRPTGGLRAATTNGSPSRLEYEAESDGLYGFFIVLHNAAGASSPPPEPGTAPQQWIRVDREAPVVQILEVRPDERFDLNRELTIRWTVEDADLPDRPVSLHYRSEQTKNYRLIAESLAGSSTYRWTVPEDLITPMEIKATAIDRASNVGRSVTSDVAFGAASRPPGVSAQHTAPSLRPAFQRPAPSKNSRSDDSERGVDPIPGFPAAVAHGEPDAGSQPSDPKVNQDARRKYESATWHRLRGETDLALARYQESLDLDPKYSAARNDMACLLLLTGKPEEAETELRKVLASEPTHRGAIKTLALVQTRQKNYRSASETLQRLLLLEPRDAEAWLYFGDVAMFMGDRSGAREAWAKVGGLETASDDVRRRATERMKLYAGRPVMSELASGEPEP